MSRNRVCVHRIVSSLSSAVSTARNRGDGAAVCAVPHARLESVSWVQLQGRLVPFLFWRNSGCM